MPSFARLITLNAAFLVLSSAIGAVRADNGMDMSMDGAMSLTAGTMRTYLHFTSGDTLWFMGWVPESRGAMAGTCIGLFLLALVDRWLAAIRAVAERSWRQREQIIMANRLNQSKTSEKEQKSPRQGPRSVLTLRSMPPFIPSHDIVRGILHAGQAAMLYTFMLAIMTFNAAFFISIVVGLGVGETLFGRFTSAASLH